MFKIKTISQGICSYFTAYEVEIKNYEERRNIMLFNEDPDEDGDGKESDMIVNLYTVDICTKNNGKKEKLYYELYPSINPFLIDVDTSKSTIVVDDIFIDGVSILQKG